MKSVLVQPVKRTLRAGHFAFMRAVVQGLDPRVSWERYLSAEGKATGERGMDATVRWIRDEFAAAAHRHGRHGLARLVRLDAGRFKFRPVLLPSLEDFAHANDLALFSEAEQVEAYQEAFSNELSAEARHTRRRQALIRRQLEALRWLESVTAEAPRRKDLVADWLDPRLAVHLERVGVVTLAQLVERINGIGRGWHASIPALGAGKASRIIGWLKDHESTLAIKLGSHVERRRAEVADDDLASVVEPATAVRPLEKFIVPAELDGRRGRFRGIAASIDDDKSAVIHWLAGSPKAANTLRAYRKEVERLLLWAVLVRGKAVSSLDHADCRAFREFLADPAPHQEWCGPRSRGRWSPLWRPFEGPLGGSARKQAEKILSMFFQHLVSSGYLIANNWLAGPTVARSQAVAFHSVGKEAVREGSGTVPPPHVLPPPRVDAAAGVPTRP